MTMMHCILKWRLICSYGISPRKRIDDESYKCAIGRVSFTQTTIQCSKKSLAEYLLEHHDLVVIERPRDLLPQADGGPWSSARVDVQSSGLKRDQCVGKISQRLRGLAFISGNVKDESIDGAGESATHESKGETISAALRQCVSLGGRRAKKMAKPWRGRLKARSASYLQLFKDLPSGPTVFSTLTLYDKQTPQKLVNRYGNQPTGLQDVAWLSLDGRLMNADTATSLDRMGGNLVDQEACVWEGLNPLQRVLIVAVAAAAAAAAKEKSTHEVARLRKVINDRENALKHMRQELSSLSSKVDMQRAELNAEGSEPPYTSAVEELASLLGQVDLRRSQPSPGGLTADPNFYTAVNQFCDSLGEFSELNDENTVSPAVNRQLNFSNVMRRVSPVKEESPISGGPGLELMEKMILSNSWIESLDIGLLLEEAADEENDDRFVEYLVNKDVVFEESGDRKEQTENCAEAEQEESRPNAEWGSGGDAQCEPVTELGSGHEWSSETSSVIMDLFSPEPLEKQRRKPVEVNTSKEWSVKSEAGENSFSARARCASIILDVKKQVISLLDEAASNMLEALNFISEKARLFGGEALTPQRPEEAWIHQKPESSSIKENVTKVASRIAALQTTMVNVWHRLGPEAMAALNISPSDFDDYLTNLQIAKILNEDATELSTASVNIQSWQEWFRRGFDNPESSFLRRIQSGDNEDDFDKLESAPRDLEQESWTPSAWPPSVDVRAQKTSASESNMVTPTVVVTAREKVDKLMSPLYEKSEDTTSIDSCSNLATVAEQLVAELEKSAAKVAAMELQMKNLKKYVKACDLKRKQVERKLLEAWEQDSKNQVKAGNEIMELKRQVRLKENAYQQLIRSRKALVAAKCQEITELREDCRRRDQALKDMGTAAQATQESQEKKLAVLEEICRKKDTSIMTLKQEIFELEGKVQELQACQTPAQLRPMNLPPENDNENDDDTDEIYMNDRSYRLFGADDCQLRSSFTSMCGSENRRTSWGSDLSAQEFHIIDTPWSSELCGGQDFNVIEEAAFQGRSLSIFQNVTSSQEFSRGTLRKISDEAAAAAAAPASGGSSSGQESSSSSSRRSNGETNPSNSHPRDIKRVNNIPSSRKELSKSVTGMVTTRPKRRDDAVRSSTGVLSTVGINTPIKPKQRSSSVSKERLSSRQAQPVNQPPNGSLNGGKPKENSSRGNSRQKWV